VLEWSEVGGGEGKRIFVDGDYGIIAAEKEPGPDADTIGERRCRWVVGGGCGRGGLRLRPGAVESVVAYAGIAASKIIGGVVPDVVYDLVQIALERGIFAGRRGMSG
jgi:hypothetical protein